MNAFSAAWLALREPADARARADTLVAPLRLALPADAAVLDLGAGCGANLRHLAPLLAGAHAWTLVDHDAALLAAFEHHATPSVPVRTLHADLRDLDRLPVPAHGLVTASALLDLVSAPWLDALAARCASSSASALFALSYDGRVTFDPGHVDDSFVVRLVNRHQRTDKGFGAALGPEATAAACRAFLSRGYRCSVAASDWVLDDGDRTLHLALLDGWRAAAQDLAPEHSARVGDWHDARRAAAAHTRVVVGHADLLALPPEPARSQS
jgi:hypothetical protein